MCICLIRLAIISTMQMDITFCQQAEEQKNFKLPLIENYEQFLTKVYERVGIDQINGWSMKYHDGQQYCVVDNQVDYQNMILGLSGDAPLLINITLDPKNNNSISEIKLEGDHHESNLDMKSSQSDFEDILDDKNQAHDIGSHEETESNQLKQSNLSQEQQGKIKKKVQNQDYQFIILPQSPQQKRIEPQHKEEVMEIAQHNQPVVPQFERVNQITRDRVRQAPTQNRNKQIKGPETTNQKKQDHAILNQEYSQEHPQQILQDRQGQLACSYCKKSKCHLESYQAFKRIATCQQCSYKWNIVPRKIRVDSTFKAPHTTKKQHYKIVCSLCQQGKSIFRLAPFDISMCQACDWKWEFTPVRRFIEMEEDFRSSQ